MIYTELNGFIENKTLNYEKLSELTNINFANVIKEEFNNYIDLPKFQMKVIEKKGFHKISGNNVDFIYVSIGSKFSSRHYIFRKGVNEKDYINTIINQDKYDNIIKPFHNAFNSSLNDAIGVDEAAEILGLSAGTVKNMCAANKLPCKKIGKTWILDKTLLSKPSK